MSRGKYIAVRLGIVLLVPGGFSTLWYQSHYAAPLAPTPERALPSPNGFNTLQDAMWVHSGPDHWPQSWQESDLTLAERQKLLAANQPLLARTREVFTQEFVFPGASVGTISYDRHLGQLLFLAKTYADSGNLPEAMRCALDAVEIGVIVPRGGRFADRESGHAYEKHARLMAWSLLGKLDAPAARQAIERLAQIEERRWPLPESLREELRQKNTLSRFDAFKDGPISVWVDLTLKSARENSGPESEGLSGMWERLKTVYGGPKSLVDSANDWIKCAQERSLQPWNPHCPVLEPESVPVKDTVYRPTYAALERDEYQYKTDAALLQTCLALHVYRLERGACPPSLEQLVTEGYLPTLPIDRFSPTLAPLQYRPEGKTFALWSVGPDGKGASS